MSPEQIEQFRALFAMLQQQGAVAGHAPEDIAGQQLAMSGAPAAQDAIREIDRKQRQAAIQELWEMTPPGSAMAAYDAAGRGDVPGFLFGALGAVPGAGVAGQAAKGAARTTKAMQKAWKAAGVADDLPVDAASRARRLVEQGNERDWWRGGVEAGDGVHYSRERDVAADFARQAKESAGRGDLREYAMGFRQPLHDAGLVPPEKLRAAAALVESYNRYAAREFRDMAATGEQVTGAKFRQMLDMQTGGTEDALKSLGYDAIIGGRDARVLDMGIVRDANRAAFDPALRGKPGLFGALAPVGIGGGLLGYGGSSFTLGERPIW